MRQMIAFFADLRRRGKQHFTVLQDAVTRNNLAALRHMAVGFEVFLLLYGILAYKMFQNVMLNRFYLLFLGLNFLILLFVIKGDRVGLHTFKWVQACCMGMILVVLGFTICVSVFPFPDRPSVFFPLAYPMMLILFQFPAWQLISVFTAVTAVFVGMVFTFKLQRAYVYDMTAALTTWLTGFFFLYIINEKNLRNGEIRMELDRQSRTDALTTLPNRRDLSRVSRREYQYCAQRGVPMGVMMLDVDHFKRFNDSFGHPEEDKCLAAIGERLDECFNQCGFYAARYGGEEFTVLLAGCGPEECAAKAQEMLERLQYEAPDGSITTVSLGVAVMIPQPDGTPDGLIQRADDALYRAKENGRDRYELDISPELQAMMAEWSSMPM